MKRYKQIVAVLLSITAATLIQISCSHTGSQSEVDKALDIAGDNRGELEAVLNHYDSLGDTLKLQAARFLIANMDGHYYGTFILTDSAGDTIDYNVLDYPDYDSLIAALSAIEAEKGELDFDKGDKLEDLKTMTADFLITQIDYAFRAWREKPWAKDLTFDEFCEYVLPYRGSDEPLEPWREYFWEKYAGIDTAMTDTTDPAEAARIINSDVMTWYTFDPRFYLHPTDQGLQEMLAGGLGRCEDMTNVTIYAMRANGLAVTSDYTPYWANSGNNHAWNAILTSDGKVVPFMGAEAQPGEYKLWNKLGKVYRKMFSQQKQNLAFQDNKQEKAPGWLAGKNYIDVTADYVDVCDVHVKFEQPVPDSVNIAYLCVFNSGEWKAIHWGFIQDNATTFTDMGQDIAYLPALYLNEEIVPFGYPFILDTNCTQHELKPDTTNPITTTLLSTTKRKLQVSTDGIAIAQFNTGANYELKYFDDGWQTVGEQIATDKPLVFDNVPADGLYWLTEEDSDREERIFTIENGQQVWW